MKPIPILPIALTPEEIFTLLILVNAAIESGLEEDGHTPGLAALAGRLVGAMG